ncbi:MAG: MarP family serine protease [Solirubrobacterales bacterium]
MTAVDWIIVAAVILLAFWGFHRGLIVGAATLGGLAVGAFLGARLAPPLLAEGSMSPYAPMAALIGAVVIGGLVALLFEGMAVALRRRIVGGPAIRAVDGVGGSLLMGAVVLLLAWLVGATVLNTPGTENVRADVQRSAILSELNSVLPPSGPILNALNRIDPAPEIRGPRADVERPDPAIADEPGVERASRSVVRVVGTACGLGVQGTGWVAGPGLIVTNAHVVAGQQDTSVQPREGGQRVRARAVHYDPNNDLAILRTDLLDKPALEFGNATAGTRAAILGFPRDGPFTVTAGRVGDTQTVRSQDSYGQGPIDRLMTPVRGDIRSGNSGGPAVDANGQVMATIFASTVGDESGFGIPNRIVASALDEVGPEVDTGPCT